MYLNGRFVGDVRHEEIHGDILAIHVLIHPVFDVIRHVRGVQIVVVFVYKSRPSENHRNLVGPLRLVLPGHRHVVPNVRPRRES